MNVGIVVRDLDPARGGAEGHAAGLIRWLLAHGHGVSVVASAWDERLNAEYRHTAPNVAFHRISARGGTKGWRARQFAIRSARGMRQLRSNGRIDVSLDLGWGAACDVVLTGVYQDNRLARARSIRHRFRRLCVRAQQILSLEEQIKLDTQRLRFGRRPPPEVVALSRRMAERFRELYQIPLSNLHVAPVGIEPPRFAADRLSPLREPARAELGVGQELLALTVAHNYRLKGVETVLGLAQRATRKQLPIRFLVVGGSPPLQQLFQRLAHAQRCDAVRFVPGTAQIERYYAAADVCLLPTFYDACSLAVLEGLAAGLPAITTLCNGAAELLEPGLTGFVAADPRDEARMEAWLTDLLDHERRARMGERARLAAQRYTSDAHYHAVAEVLERAAGAASDG